MKNSGVVTLVLGGGAGTRLAPLTRYRAKPAVPIGGAYRLIDIPLSNAINSGFSRIFVLTQFNSESLNRHIAQTYRFDHFSGGYVDILAASLGPDTGSWYQGTADAVRQNLQHLEHIRFDHVLILSGDHLYRMDYRSFLKTHIENDADVTVAAAVLPKERASSFGVIEEEEGRVIGFREKPALSEVESMPKDLHMSMGIYIFRRKVLEEILTQERGNDFGGDILPAMKDDYRLFVHPHHGFWEDVGTIETYYRVSLSLTDPNPPFTMVDPVWPLFSHPRFLSVSSVQNSSLDRVLIGEGGCVRGSTIRHSLVGQRSQIGVGCTIADSIIMGEDYYEAEIDALPGLPPLGIGEGSFISGAIVDKNVRMGAGCRIENGEGIKEAEEDLYVIRDGIVIVPKNSILPDGTVIP